jgi:HEAT repeat protein
MEAIVMALALLVAADEPLPGPDSGGSTDPAWRAALTVIMGALGSEMGKSVDPQAVDQAWAALVGDHRDALPSLLTNLRGVPRLHSRLAIDVLPLVMAAMPSAGLAALVWSLEHPGEVRSLGRFDHGWRSVVVSVLGELGSRSAPAVLRRLANDREVGEAAAAAVRAIEQRMSA